jgi:O-antigen/teichoic acid export membrane protein
MVSVAKNKHQKFAAAYVGVTLFTLLGAWFLSPRLGIMASGCAVLTSDVLMCLFVVPLSLRMLDEKFSVFLKETLQPPLDLLQRLRRKLAIGPPKTASDNAGESPI